MRLVSSRSLSILLTFTVKPPLSLWAYKPCKEEVTLDYIGICTQLTVFFDVL